MAGFIFVRKVAMRGAALGSWAAHSFSGQLAWMALKQHMLQGNQLALLYSIHHTNIYTHTNIYIKNRYLYTYVCVCVYYMYVCINICI